jgi:hypothetical protein
VVAPLYAEAWYDLDVPFTARPRRDGRARRAGVTGLLSLGYVHSRFDGRGINFGPVIGFLGPLHVEWSLRVRPRGSKAAVQASLGAIVGNGLATMATVGAVLPDLRTPARASRRRSTNR